MADKEEKTLLNEPPDVPASDEHTLIRGQNDAEATPASPKDSPYMVVVDGPHAGAKFPLTEDAPNVVGRASGNAIRLEDQSVSRQHCEITKGVSGWVVKDLGSKNGTLVNGQILADSVVIGHKDVIKTGIYQLRLITQPTRVEEEMTLPPEIVTPDRTIFVAAPQDGLTSEIHRRDATEDFPEVPEEREPPPMPRPEEEIGISTFKEMQEEEPPRFNIRGFIDKLAGLNRRQLVLYGSLAVVVLVALIFFTGRLLRSGKAVKPQPVAAETEGAEAPQGEPQAIPAIPTTPEAGVAPIDQGGAPQALPAGGVQPQLPVSPPATEAAPALAGGTVPSVSPSPPVPGALPTPAVPAGPITQPPEGSAGLASSVPGAPPAAAAATIPVFLDLASSPMPAKVTFQNKDLGMTPQRINIELEAGRSYQAQALFSMPEIDQQYTQTIDFQVAKDQSVVPILFRGPIGMIKIMDLPRDVEFYLEGKFSYDKFQEQSAKLKEVVLQKPMYIPFGRYALELRRAKQLGETSPNYVADIIFRREFQIAEDSPTYVLEVKEQDLTVFPAKVRSDPPNADVFVDGKLVGKTPFEGVFPLGEHKLALRKEGYFDHVEDLKMDINMPFTSEVKLKTSVAGAHINNARQAMNRAMYQEAVNELAEALNSTPAPSEVGLVNYLLGVSYLRLNDVQRAIGYFEQAKADESQRLFAVLGLANCYAISQRLDQALPLLVEVLLKGKDDQLKKDAHDLFQKISPFKSVMYVYSDPVGAKVVVNDKPIAQATPVILHELPLGNYKIHIEKAGYQPTDLSISLSVNEFNPIIVKLKPIEQ